MTARWWTHDPRSREDLFAPCSRCPTATPDDENHRAHQQLYCCPYIPRAEWHDGGNEDAEPCDGAYARSAAALELARARLFFEKGQLALLYPDGVPLPVIEALHLDDVTHAEFVKSGRKD